MSATLLGLASALISGGALAAAATYLALRRTNSGKIGTSDAATLWQASEIMRRELRDEVVRLRSNVEALEHRVGELTAEIQTLNTRLAHQEGLRGQP